MESKYYLLCPLCSYETSHITLSRTHRHVHLKKKWMVCMECRHLQEKPHPKKLFLQSFKLLWLHVKHYVIQKRKRPVSTVLPKLFQKPTCQECRSVHLLEWDGNCPRCGSAFLKKIV